MITHLLRDRDQIRVRGTTSDSNVLRRVTVNDRPAYLVRGEPSVWEIAFDLPRSAKSFPLSAFAEDEAGNVEKQPHALTVHFPDTAAAKR